MLKQIVLLAVAVSCVSANLAFTDCGSTSTVHALRIAGCNALPCQFRRGQTYIIEMDVTASEYQIVCCVLNDSDIIGNLFVK